MGQGVRDQQLGSEQGHLIWRHVYPLRFVLVRIWERFVLLVKLVCAPRSETQHKEEAYPLPRG